MELNKNGRNFLLGVSGKNWKNRQKSQDLSKQYGELDMELNKNGRNFLLGTLFKSYLIQTAVCSLIILVCTDVMDVAVSQIFRKCFGDYFFMYYRSLYTYMAGFAGWVICVIYLTVRM